jgi:hypothetical protein
MPTVFLGAGFSKWAAGLPLATELFDFELDLLSQADTRRLFRLQNDWESWRRRNPTGTAEQFIYWSLNASSHRRSRVTWYVTRRLSQPFMTRIQGNYATMMINDRRAREHQGTQTAKTFLSLVQAATLPGIITTNYDMLVEFALGTEGFNYGRAGEYLSGRGHNPQFPWQNTPVFVTGKIPLAKIHGSVSWDESYKWTDGKPGRAGHALIVPPAPEKLPPKSLKSVWQLAGKVLSRSSEIIIFGFAFNPYDSAVLKLLERGGSKLRSVLLIDPYPKITVAQNLWPKAVVQTVTDMRDPLPLVRAWLGSLK